MEPPSFTVFGETSLCPGWNGSIVSWSGIWIVANHATKQTVYLIVIICKLATYARTSSVYDFSAIGVASRIRWRNLLHTPESATEVTSHVNVNNVT